MLLGQALDGDFVPGVHGCVIGGGQERADEQADHRDHDAPAQLEFHRVGRAAYPDLADIEQDQWYDRQHTDDDMNP